MQTQQQLNYSRIAKAIAFINSDFKKQPSLAEIAANVQLSPAHFQRLFTDWAGTSPKKFLQYISVQHAKNMLKEQQETLFKTTYQTGLSSTSRLHDLFINIEGMTPGEYKNGGKNLHLNFSFEETLFGSLIIAATPIGVCYIAFYNNQQDALSDLKAQFPNATLQQKSDALQQNALAFFNKDWQNLQQVKLHLKGTNFQLKVWESLLKIPMGNLTTYGKIATEIGNTNAARAVGTAIGSNPIAFIIPCHRVIQSSGILGGYMWGPSRKAAIIGWEAAHCAELP